MSLTYVLYGEIFQKLELLHDHATCKADKVNAGFQNFCDTAGGNYLNMLAIQQLNMIPEHQVNSAEHQPITVKSIQQTAPLQLALSQFLLLLNT